MTTHTIRRRLAAAALAVCVALAGACGSGDTSDAVPEKYKQTWAKSYRATTCTDWQGQMTAEQRWAAAADMLTGARSKDGSDDLPPDELVDTFEAGVTTVCSTPSMDTLNLAEVGATLYLTERARFAP